LTEQAKECDVPGCDCHYKKTEEKLKDAAKFCIPNPPPLLEEDAFLMIFY
jgi:hypothetical protein